MNGLTNKNVFATVLEIEQSKIQALADLVLGESPLFSLQMAIFFCPHMAEIRE